MDILAHAEHWVGIGIPVIPINYRTKYPAADALRMSGDVDENGRATWGRYQHDLPQPETLRRWFTGPRRNLAVITGAGGLVVIDFDLMDAYVTWAAWAEAYAPRMLETYTVRTGRGIHLYVFADEPVPTGHLGVIDVKAAGGYVLVPPSLHPSGRQYQEAEPGAPILRVATLGEVLPFEIGGERPAYPVADAKRDWPAPALSDDPWELADHPPAAVPAGGLVQAIRQTVRIEDMLPGVAGQRGRWARVRCPFHEDVNPSFWIDLERQICGCFAGCTPKPLDVISLFARLHGLTNREAILTLSSRVGLSPRHTEEFA